MSFLKIRETIEEYYSNVDITDPLEEEKIQLFKDTETCLTIESMVNKNVLEKNTETYIDYLTLREEVLEQFHNLYIKPYYGILGDHFATCEVVSFLANDATGEYLHFENKVKILDRDNILDMLHTMGHEYEHNLQYKGEFLNSMYFSTDNFEQIIENFKSKVKDFKDKKPWELNRESFNIFKHRRLNDEIMSNLYKIHKNYHGEVRWSVPDEVYFYYNQAIERDSRLASYSLMLQFGKEMSKYSNSSSAEQIIEIAKNNIMYEENRTEENLYYKPILEVTKIIDEITSEHYLEYCKTAWEGLENQQAEIYAKYIESLGLVRKGEISKEEMVAVEKLFNEHICRDFEKTISSALLMQYYDLNLDMGNVLIKNYDKAVPLYIEFVRNGCLFAAEALKLYNNYDIPYEEHIDEKIEKGLWKMFKEGNITTESCKYIKQVMYGVTNDEFFAQYLKDGKYEFCSAILDTMNDRKISERAHILFDADDSYYKWTPKGLAYEFEYYQKGGYGSKWKQEINEEHFNNKYNLDDFNDFKKMLFAYEVKAIKKSDVFNALTSKFKELKQQQKEGTLVFDDLDDFIILISNLCKFFNVEYDKETIYFSDEKNSRAKKEPYSKENISIAYICRYLYSLYVEAEKMAYKEVCKKLHDKPSEDNYRFAHPEDRRKYRLKGEAADKRYLEIYGETQYKAMIYQREILEKTDEEILMADKKFADEGLTI